MIATPQPTRLPTYDWPAAVQHLAAIRQQIEAGRIVFFTGVENFIICYIRPLEHRYAAGERSADLYEAMMGVKFREGK